MANLPAYNYSPSKSSYSLDSVDPMSPWSYYSAYSNNVNSGNDNNNNGDAFNVMQPYEMNHWEQQASLQNMLENWTPPPGSEHEHMQKPNFLDLPSASLPPTPPNQTLTSSIGLEFLATLNPPKDIIPPLSSSGIDNPYSSSFGTSNPTSMFTSSATPTFMATPSNMSSSSSSPSSSASSFSPPVLSLLPFSSSSSSANNKYRRRCSENPLPRVNRPIRRRASSQPSVASVVSLTAHEPTSEYVDGVEYITFLYSHERLVKEYTVCADVASIDVDTIPMLFKAQNTIYPRANVERNKYDGNRWDYETSCNALGWKLCWLNQSQLCGRRGLIQRAVDSYRNRHAEMRSRRVARQQKVANGTLRKRKSKKSVSVVTSST
ncbi:hypothetical protein BCR42DRAFT_402866 [Absidia repens]|uniref:DUF8032 domain-containing protein n=1 Tax=Absidia repens TaxID=90262 RepID=A0A1X2IYM2_9FUNG|nr:hypothetical protein BCR42DRAFT_402866 [Absidia repens]